MSFSTFFHKIEDAFKSIFGSSNWEKTASTTIAVIAPLVEAIVTSTAGEADAAQVVRVVTEVQADLGVVSSLLAAVSAGTTTSADAAQKISAVLIAIEQNLQGLLAAGHIKNPQTLAKVQSIVTTVVGEVSAILGAMKK